MKKTKYDNKKINDDLDKLLYTAIESGLGKNKSYTLKKDTTGIIAKPPVINQSFSYKKLLIIMIASISNHLFTKLILSKPNEIERPKQSNTLDDVQDYKLTISASALSLIESKPNLPSDSYTYHFNDSLLTKNKLNLEKKKYGLFYTKLSQVILDLSHNKVKLTKE